MGLFGGLIGGLFGGGSKTTVTQQVANNTQVDVGVDIQNILDLTPIAAVMEWLGVKEGENAQTVAASNLALAHVLQNTAAAEQNQQQQLIQRIAPWAKLLTFTAIAYVVVIFFRK